MFLSFNSCFEEFLGAFFLMKPLSAKLCQTHS